MKILFIHPGPLLYTNVFLRLEPLGLELVAEAARRAKHSVRLLDLQVESYADYHRMIAEWQPDFIAFSCNYLANVPEIVDLAKATRLALPRSFVCVGGHSASFTGPAILEHGEGAARCSSCNDVNRAPLGLVTAQAHIFRPSSRQFLLSVPVLLPSLPPNLYLAITPYRHSPPPIRIARRYDYDRIGDDVAIHAS